MNHALLALRDLLVPGTGQAGVVVSVSAGQCTVATRNGARTYPIAPGLVVAADQRVLVENGLVVRVLGARAEVPVLYV